MKQLHVALGIQRADEAMIAQLLVKAPTSGARVAALRDLVKRWPEDLELGLKLLYALEDDEKFPIARSYAQQLRRRSDATLHVRMQVGEFHLRQAAMNEPAKAQETEEALRCFGEIVEFAPEDPVARRNLGDLLLAHGWFDEAFRQYQTLQQLTPEDPSVELRLAEAAYGMGKTEEALRWTEKARAAASPDGQTDLECATSATPAAWTTTTHL
jgi:Ca-activated chloride channel family protein